MAKRKRVYSWYISPNLSVPEVNRHLVDCCPAEDFSIDVICANGERRNLCKCTSEVRNGIIARFRLGSDFEIFCKVGSGTPKNVSFLFKKKNKGLMQKAAE
jgi:hypothetical protein